MIRSFVKQVLSLALSSVLASSPAAVDAVTQASEPASNYAGQGAQLTTQELQALVAPIALYPDALVAQIVGAATFPDQVAVAQYWLEQNKSLTGNALMQAADKEKWDPSVKALTQFPSVLENMAKNLSWVSSLGEAYHNQTSEIMSAVQTLRAQAKAAGNLKSGSQITVVQQSPQTIVIQPTNPQVVYVPQYNPTVVYGTPYVTPGYTGADLLATGILSFGAGMAIGALIGGGGGCCSWGWNSWGCNWHGGAVVYNQNNFYGNRAWHGGYYGGATPYRGGSYGARGSYGSVATANGRSAAVSRTAYGNSAVARTANGNSYAEHNGNLYRNTGNGVQKDNNRNWNNVSRGSVGSSDTARGWGQRTSGSSSAFSGWGGRSGSSTSFGGGDRFGGGSGGWGSRSASSRGWGSRGGGGGWGGGGGGFRGGGRR